MNYIQQHWFAFSLLTIWLVVIGIFIRFISKTIEEETPKNSESIIVLPDGNYQMQSNITDIGLWLINYTYIEAPTMQLHLKDKKLIFISSAVYKTGPDDPTETENLIRYFSAEQITSLEQTIAVKHYHQFQERYDDVMTTVGMN
jgi:hypothetical protein